MQFFGVFIYFDFMCLVELLAYVVYFQLVLNDVHMKYNSRFFSLCMARMRF